MTSHVARTASTRRWIRCGLATAVVVFATSCGSSQFDIARATPATSWRSDRALGAVQLVLKGDRRPLEERGLRAYVGGSWLGGRDLVEPLEIAFLRIIARDLTTSGLSHDARVAAEGQPLLLEMTLENLGCRYSEGLENLAFLLATSSLHAEVSILFRWRDHEGRVFFESEFHAARDAKASPASGLRERAVSLLSEAIRDAIDQMLPRLTRSIEDFWMRYDRPGDSGLSSLRESRSSTAR